LDAGPGFDSYVWNDNSTEETLTISEEGKYWVTGYFMECLSSDTIVLLRANCNVYVPNAFTPNNDGINDEFFALPNESISEFKMIIFNRWGLMLKKLDNIYEHWDGKYKGQKVQEGVYYWVITYECVGSSEKKRLQGSVTVIY
jgi:gliding motility-associated-like protein